MSSPRPSLTNISIPENDTVIIAINSPIPGQMLGRTVESLVQELQKTTNEISQYEEKSNSLLKSDATAKLLGGGVIPTLFSTPLENMKRWARKLNEQIAFQVNCHDEDIIKKIEALQKVRIDYGILYNRTKMEKSDPKLEKDMRDIQAKIKVLEAQLTLAEQQFSCSNQGDANQQSIQPNR